MQNTTAPAMRCLLCGGGRVEVTVALAHSTWRMVLTVGSWTSKYSVGCDRRDELDLDTSTEARKRASEY